MELFENIAGIAFVCSPDGVIKEIFRDELNMSKKVTPGQSFVDLVDKENKEKASLFLHTVSRNKAAFDWEINVSDGPKITTFHFAGTLIHNDIFVIGAKSRSEVVLLFEEISKINNEQANTLRSVIKDASLKKHSWADRELELYDELSSLNNQLINLQRELVKKNFEIKKSEEMFKALAESSLTGVFLFQDLFLYINPTMKKITGYTENELLTMHPWEIIAPEFRERAKQAIGERSQGRKDPILYKEIKLVTKDGEERWGAVYTNSIEYKGRLAELGNLIDITEKRKLEEELIRAATTDKLTETFNRRKFESLLSSEIERANRYFIPLSLCMFDIDHFKMVNDTYGHLTGDHVLKTLANVARNTARKVDSLGRWGGEEFVVLLPETDLEGAKELAEKIRKSVEEHPFEWIRTLTCSFGVTQFKDRESIDSFIKRADDALYSAKNKGRNRVETSP